MASIMIADLNPVDSEMFFNAELSPEEIAAILGGWGLPSWRTIKSIGVGVVVGAVTGAAYGALTANPGAVVAGAAYGAVAGGIAGGITGYGIAQETQPSPPDPEVYIPY